MEPSGTKNRREKMNKKTKETKAKETKAKEAKIKERKVEVSKPVEEKTKKFDIKAHRKPLIIGLAILLVVILSVVLFGWIGLWYDLLLAAIVGIALTGMKKYSLFKVMLILTLLIILATNLLQSRQESIERIAIADSLLNYFSIVVQNFGSVILFALAIGGFYGVLNKTPSYKKLLDNIVTKVKPMGKRFVILSIILFAIITSFTGITLPLLVFVPFVVAIILLLGYDKLVAFSATVASILVGYIGGVFVHFLNPNTYAVMTFEEFVGTKLKFANMFPKLLLLFAGIALLIYYVNKYIKNVEEKKVKYELNDNSDLLIAEVKGNYKDIKTWPLIVVLALIFIIIVLGMVPWSYLFKVEVFSKFHTWLTGLKIKKFELIPSLISSSLPALGEWLTSGNIMGAYIYISMLLVFFSIIIALINRVKFNELIESYTEGLKKMLPTVVLISIAYNVLVCAYNNGFLELLISNYGKFNFGVSSLLAALGCILNVDLIWILVGVYQPIVTLITDEAVYAPVAMLLQGIYGIISLVGPTSIILIIGLTYLDIPYTTWLKYIWRFILMLIILLALVTLLVTLI